MSDKTKVYRCSYGRLYNAKPYRDVIGLDLADAASRAIVLGPPPEDKGEALTSVVLLTEAY